jgi:hypothetical protein
VYILDTNVLIDANRDYYPLSVVPEFWEWIVYMGTHGKVKTIIDVFEELRVGDDELSSWAKRADVIQALLLDEEITPEAVTKVTYEGYAPDLSDVEIDNLGRDPFIVAFALMDKDNRIVVTTEISKPTKTRQNRKLPDVCGHFGIRSCNTYQLIKQLGFSTHWKEHLYEETT